MPQDHFARLFPSIDAAIAADDDDRRKRQSARDGERLVVPLSSKVSFRDAHNAAMKALADHAAVFRGHRPGYITAPPIADEELAANLDEAEQARQDWLSEQRDAWKMEAPPVSDSGSHSHRKAAKRPSEVHLDDEP